MTVNFYKKLYIYKLFNKLVFKQILKCVNKKINYKLKKSIIWIISERKIIISIKWTVLRKLLNNNNLFLKFYKAL